jgi:DnaJ-class molecular chaperone
MFHEMEQSEEQLVFQEDVNKECHVCNGQGWLKDKHRICPTCLGEKVTGKKEYKIPESVWKSILSRPRDNWGN